MPGLRALDPGELLAALGRAALGFALGLAAALAYFFLFRAGINASSAAAVVLAGAAILASLPAALFGSSAGAALAYAFFIPRLGASKTAALAAACAVFGIIAARARVTESPSHSAAQRTIAALFLAASVGLIRIYSLLIGHALFAFSGFFAAACLGAALARRATPRVELAAPALGLLCLFGLGVLRFVGLNAADANYLLSPIRSTSDIWSVVLPPLALFAALGAAAGVAFRPGAGESRPSAWARNAAAAVAGPAAGFWLLRLHGPENAALICGLALAALGAALAYERFKSDPVLPALAAVLLAAAGLMGLRSRSLLRDVGINRLNAVFPGGRFLAARENGDERIELYQFASGVKAVLNEETSDFRSSVSDQRWARFSLLLSSASSALVSGARSAEAIDAALPHAAVEVEAGEALQKILIEADSGQGLRRAAEAAFVSPNARAPSPKHYDLILVDEMTPPQNPRNAFRFSREGLALLKASLSQRGLLSLRTPPFGGAFMRARLAKTLQGSFAHLAFCAQADAVLFFASDQDLAPLFDKIEERVPNDFWLEDSKLSDYLKDRRCSAVAPVEDVSEETDDRPRNAFVLNPASS